MSILLTAVMMIITVVSPMTIAFQIIYNLRSEDQAKSLKLIYKILLSIAALACVVFACVSSVYVFDRIADLAETNTVIKKQIDFLAKEYRHRFELIRFKRDEEGED